MLSKSSRFAVMTTTGQTETIALAGLKEMNDTYVPRALQSVFRPTPAFNTPLVPFESMLERSVFFGQDLFFM